MEIQINEEVIVPGDTVLFQDPGEVAEALAGFICRFEGTGTRIVSEAWDAEIAQRRSRICREAQDAETA